MISRIDKLKEIAEAKLIDSFLITSSVTINYLCGYFYNFETGPSPFQLIPSALYIMPEKNSNLIIADNECGQLTEISSEIKINQYASYTYEKPLDFTQQFLNQLKNVLNQNNAGPTSIGVEANSLPYSVFNFIVTNYSNIKIVDISSELALIRMVKDSHEIDLICAATLICDAGQEAVLKCAKPGITELELFASVRSDMEFAAGKRIPIMADMVCGSRTFEGGGSPSGRIIKQGDLILSDLTPCLNGYWGDTCNTVSIGKPTRKLMMHYKMVKETLDMAINEIKPGIKAKTIDRLMRKNLSSAGGYKHHSGHGVGIAYHEEPRIVPYNETVLVPNMVIALEPGIYTNGYGIRLEHMVLVTPSGCKVLSKFDHRFEQI